MVGAFSRGHIAALACLAAALSWVGVADARLPDTEATTAAAHEADSTIAAVWKPQQLSFVYRGFDTTYTCTGLRETLERILVNVGAREGLKLRSYACDDHSAAARFEISVESPVAATPENIRELTTYDSTDALIARTRGERLAAAEDLPRFPAVWKTVSFARDRKMRLEPGDCELVQQLRRQILPKLSIRILRDNVRCSSAFGNIGRPRLTVSALVPARASARVDD